MQNVITDSLAVALSLSPNVVKSVLLPLLFCYIFITIILLSAPSVLFLKDVFNFLNFFSFLLCLFFPKDCSINFLNVLGSVLAELFLSNMFFGPHK